MKRIKTAAAAGMFVGLCLCGQAAMLLPGDSGLDTPQASGPAAIRTRTTAYHFGSLSGTITTWVVRDPANPLGGLSYYYQINNTGRADVGRVSIANLAPGEAVEVSTIAGLFNSSRPGGVAPTTAGRASGTGGPVGFDFNGASEINQGQWSEILVVNTSYQGSRLPTVSVINDKVFDTGLMAISTVPEPSTIIAGSLLLISFGASALRVVRKR